MPLFPLKLIASFMCLIGLAVLIALAIPATASHMQPQIPIAVVALTTFFSGAGFFSLKRWGTYLFFLSYALTYLANLIVYGAPHVGNSWIGLVLVGGISLLYWKKLS